MSSGFERSREVNGISVDTDGPSTKIQCLDDLSDLRDQADVVTECIASSKLAGIKVILQLLIIFE
jgi:hypothetical protein